MEKQKYETKVFSDYEDRFQYFLALALLFILMDVFITDKKSKWSGRFNIFDLKKEDNEK